MMVGDRVRYTEAHWAWMVNVGRAQPAHRREEQTGRVESVKGTTATVAWDGTGVPWPFVTRVESRESVGRGPTVHLRENLEVAP